MYRPPVKALKVLNSRKFSNVREPRHPHTSVKRRVPSCAVPKKTSESKDASLKHSARVPTGSTIASAPSEQFSFSSPDTSLLTSPAPVKWLVALARPRVPMLDLSVLEPPFPGCVFSPLPCHESSDEDDVEDSQSIESEDDQTPLDVANEDVHSPIVTSGEIAPFVLPVDDDEPLILSSDHIRPISLSFDDDESLPSTSEEQPICFVSNEVPGTASPSHTVPLHACLEDDGDIPELVPEEHAPILLSEAMKYNLDRLLDEEKPLFPSNAPLIALQAQLSSVMDGIHQLLDDWLAEPEYVFSSIEPL